MNVLDANVFADQRLILRRWRIPSRQIGVDLGVKGMSDENIIPLLLELRRPTLFTLDADFYWPSLRHDRYCLVWLNVRGVEAAEYIRRFLRHPEFNTQAKRMSAVVAIAPAGLSVWRVGAEQVTHSVWPAKTRNDTGDHHASHPRRPPAIAPQLPRHLGQRGRLARCRRTAEGERPARGGPRG